MNIVLNKVHKCTSLAAMFIKVCASIRRSDMYSIIPPTQYSNMCPNNAWSLSNYSNKNQQRTVLLSFLEGLLHNLKSQEKFSSKAKSA